MQNNGMDIVRQCIEMIEQETVGLFDGDVELQSEHIEAPVEASLDRILRETMSENMAMFESKPGDNSAPPTKTLLGEIANVPSGAEQQSSRETAADQGQMSGGAPMAPPASIHAGLPSRLPFAANVPDSAELSAVNVTDLDMLKRKLSMLTIGIRMLHDQIEEKSLMLLNNSNAAEANYNLPNGASMASIPAAEGTCMEQSPDSELVRSAAELVAMTDVVLDRKGGNCSKVDALARLQKSHDELRSRMHSLEQENRRLQENARVSASPATNSSPGSVVTSQLPCSVPRQQRSANTITPRRHGAAGKRNATPGRSQQQQYPSIRGPQGQKGGSLRDGASTARDPSPAGRRTESRTDSSIRPPTAPRPMSGRASAGSSRQQRNPMSSGGHGFGLKPRPMQREDTQETTHGIVHVQVPENNARTTPRGIGTPRTPYTPRMGGSVTVNTINGPVNGNPSPSSSSNAAATHERPRTASQRQGAHSPPAQRKGSPRGGASSGARRARSWSPPKRGAPNSSAGGGSEKALPSRWRTLVANAYQEATGKPLVDRIRLLECNSAPCRKSEPYVFWLHTMVRWGDLRLVDSERRAERGEDLTLFVLHCQRAAGASAKSACDFSGSQSASLGSVDALNLSQQSRRQQRLCHWDVSEESVPPARQGLITDAGYQWSVVSVRVLNSLSALSDATGSESVHNGVVGAALFLAALGQLLTDVRDMSPGPPHVRGPLSSGHASPSAPSGTPATPAPPGQAAPLSARGYNDGSMSVPSSSHGVRTPSSPAATPGVPMVPPLLLGNISKTSPPLVNVKTVLSARSSRGIAALRANPRCC